MAGEPTLTATRPLDNQTAPVEKPIPARRRRPWTIPLAAGVLITVAALGVLYYRAPSGPESVSTGSTVSTEPSTLPEPTPPTRPAPEPPTTVPTGTLQVDALPWANVSIKPITGQIALPQSTYVTPVHLDLPYGQYEIRFENPEYGSSGRTVTVGPQPALVRVTMPGFDADRVINSILNAR